MIDAHIIFSKWFKHKLIKHEFVQNIIMIVCYFYKAVVRDLLNILLSISYRITFIYLLKRASVVLIFIIPSCIEIKKSFKAYHKSSFMHIKLIL
jgi:hypothetical protein